VGEILEFRSLISNRSDHFFVGNYGFCKMMPDGDNVLVPDEPECPPVNSVATVPVFYSASVSIDNPGSSLYHQIL